MDPGRSFSRAATCAASSARITTSARPISGDLVSANTLAAVMLELQDCGCHNINFVSPSHVVPQILEAVLIAARRGLNLPLVYNTGGYDALEMLKLLDGVIDIYMPDMKYASQQAARFYSKIPEVPAGKPGMRKRDAPASGRFAAG